MQSSFTLRKDELTMDFLQGLKQMFIGPVLDITVSDNASADTDEIDATEFLLSNPNTRERLLESVAQGRSGKITTLDADALWPSPSPQMRLKNTTTGLSMTRKSTSA